MEIVIIYARTPKQPINLALCDRKILHETHIFSDAHNELNVLETQKAEFTVTLETNFLVIKTSIT